MTAQQIRRGAGSCVLGWLLLLAGPARASAQAGPPLLVLSQAALRASGRTRLDQALQALLPSLNRPSPSVAGAADHLPPVTLRGLGADQLVVRVNGRRRPAGPLLTGEPVVGRGEPLSDLAAIPLSAVAQVALYAGDAARFGFGAVAGVLEVTLLDDAPDALTAQLGLTTAGDGGEAVLGGTHRARWGGDGRLQLSAELAARGATNRAAPDARPQYFTGDPRNDDPPSVHQRFGEPEATSFAGVLSAAKPV
ncbi:MAG TPA: TonB-dependent receptor plug domain-containing protein, partial [Gemmatimonadales bacterium]|nr:TonB-dependent receptor plug domain-containing protein [Gemmatimonadales bacterium]